MEIEEKKEKDKKKLEEIITFFDKTHLSTDDFIKSFSVIVKIIKDLKKTNENEFDLIHKNFSLMSDKLQNDTGSGVANNKKEMMDYCHAEMEKMYKEHEKMMAGMDAKMKEVKDGKDADEAIIVGKVLAQIPTPKEIAKEITFGDISIMKGFQDIINEIKNDLKKSIPVSSGRFFGGSVVHKFMDDEIPTGTKNGTNTIFTVSKSPLSLKVYRGGARQRVGEDYTLSNKTITFIVAPSANEIILCDYRHY